MTTRRQIPAKSAPQYRMRVIAWQLAPVVMKDDGDTLETVTVQPQIVPAAQWEAFKNGGDAEALESLRVQIELPADADNLPETA